MDQRPLPYRPAAELQPVLDDLNRLGNPLDNLTPQSAPRLWFQRELAARSILAPIPVHSVRDLFVPARNHVIPCRIYTPGRQASARRGRLPGLLYAHGGGWTLGSIATYDSIARELANRIPAVVILPEYRLAPECPFPAALDDVRLVLEWLGRNVADLAVDPARLAVAGDSAGGTLATVVAWQARQVGLNVAFQALFYPCTDLSSTATASYEQYGEGHWLTRRAVEAFRDFYLPDRRDWTRPEASPLLAGEEELQCSPPALIVTCGCDPLRDEGEAYAQRLRAMGVPVRYRLEEAMIHACLGLCNSRLYPAASARVMPLLADIARIIGDACP